MDLADDGALLRRFAEEADEGAFRALVGRHLALVQGIATRQLGGDAALAEDVAQRVFALLAARAGRMSGHPSVAGWLFTTTRKTAANARRANLRRLRRETEGATMQTDETRAETAALWQEVRPLLDEGLARLGEGEREALLWRIAEGAGYAEIAARLGLKENAARMRVERALEKLRSWLARRGVTSTAAALGAAVGAHAAPAVTAAAVGQVAAGALAGAAAIGGAATMAVAAVDFMSKAKVLGVVAAVAVGLAVYEAREVRRQTREAQAWQQRAIAAEQQVAGQREALAEAVRRAQAADEDNARLLAGIAQAGPALTRVAANEAGEAKVSRAEATQRLERAKALRKEGKHAEALAEFLWCFDAMRGFSFFGQHTITIPEELAKLVADYPAAREVILAKRAEALQRLGADEKDDEAFMDYLAMTKSLNDPAALIEALNQFPAESNRRGMVMTLGASDALLEARSYGVLAKEQPYEKMVANLAVMLALPESFGKIDDAGRAKAKRSTLSDAAKNFEVLVGIGAEDQAQALAAKILAADGSAEVRAELEKHATRAGRSDWKLP